VQVSTPNGLIIKAKEYFNEVKSLVSSNRHLANLLNFFLGVQILYPFLFTFFLLKYLDLSLGMPILISFLSNLTGTLVAIWLLYRDIKDGWRIFKENKFGNFKLVFKHFLFILLGNLIINLIILWITGEMSSSNNQDNIMQVFDFSPYLMGIMIVGFAPVLEELVFRNTIFRRIYERFGLKTGLLISGFLFGLMHVIISLASQDYMDLINIFIYVHIGVQLSLLHYKSGTIIAPITLHFINNFISLFALVGLLK